MPAKRKTRKGAPTKLSLTLIRRVERSIRNGNYFETAVEAAGVALSTGYLWKKQGEEDALAGRDTLHRSFAEAVHRAKPEGIERLVNSVSKAAVRNWKAAAFMLGVKDKRFLPQVQVTVHKELTGALDRLEQALTPEEFDRVAAIIAGEAGVGEASSPPAPAGTAETDRTPTE